MPLGNDYNRTYTFFPQPGKENVAPGNVETTTPEAGVASLAPMGQGVVVPVPALPAPPAPEEEQVGTAEVGCVDVTYAPQEEEVDNMEDWVTEFDP